MVDRKMKEKGRAEGLRHVQSDWFLGSNMVPLAILGWQSLGVSGSNDTESRTLNPMNEQLVT